MSIASQDFRDGAATGAHEAIERVILAMSYGISMDPTVLRSIAATLRSEYGGVVIDR